ncbi:MAG: hypothetical protein HY885_07330, partial [Deltaproteobacteria bacterium]|nr:hypothetical protein [Deltaproteobacteria bacterium]
MSSISASAPPQKAAPHSRINSIEMFRVIGMLGVVMLHTKPFMQDLFPDPPYRLLENLFAQPSRFAVPFFFATAG